MFRKARRLHFVGIGGSGMSGIAEVLVNLGYPVSGSDLAVNQSTRRLKKLGAKVHRGHRAENVQGADVVVVSSAVHEDNPEVIEARRRKIPVVPRAEMLAELMRMKYGVAVAGAHGKTTTTGMVAEVLTAAGIDPTVVIGGRVRALRSGAKLGKGEVLVAEADESDGSFLKMKPTIAVVTNIDREHLDHYADLAAIQDAFVRFLSQVPFYGAAVVCLDEPNLRAILPRVDRKVIGYGLGSDADLTATEVELKGMGVSYVARWRGASLGKVRLAVPGRHSVYNSLAAAAVGLELDVPFPTIARALGRFRGVDRRFQLKGKAFGALVVDDYAHHPTEIQATLAAAREGFGVRTLVVFQPHRYSRTRALLEEFGRAFFLADKIIVTDVYPAGESRIAGVDGAAVAAALVRHGHPSVTHAPGLEKATLLVREMVLPGDLILTLGAGDVWKVGEALLKAAPEAPGPEEAEQEAVITEKGPPGTEQDRRYWRRRVNRHVRKTRRTRVLLRWTGIVLGNLAVAAILVVSAGGAVRHLTTCQELSLETIEVEGTSKTTPEAIRSTLDRFVGRNLLDMELEEVVEAVRTDPWVLRASVKRILPHALRVNVVERTPAAIALLSGIAHVIDEEGFAIGPAGPGLTYDLPILTGVDARTEVVRRSALARGAAVVARLRTEASGLFSVISEIDLSKSDRIAIVTSTPGPRILLDPEKVERNVDEYIAVRRRIEGKVGPAELVDLRWNRRISVLPSEDLSLSGSE